MRKELDFLEEDLCWALDSVDAKEGERCFKWEKKR